MGNSAEPESHVTSLLRELEAARARITEFQARSRGGETALKAFALCDEVERLCQEAALSADPARTNELLAKSRSHLNELQKLLGVH